LIGPTGLLSKVHQLDQSPPARDACRYMTDAPPTHDDDVLCSHCSSLNNNRHLRLIRRTGRSPPPLHPPTHRIKLRTLLFSRFQTTTFPRNVITLKASARLFSLSAGWRDRPEPRPPPATSSTSTCQVTRGGGGRVIKSSRHGTGRFWNTKR
jgi:hypothetical protein